MRRTAFRQTPQQAEAANDSEELVVTVQRLHPCKVCLTLFERRNSMHVACSPRCAMRLVASQKRAEKEERCADRGKREALKTLKELRAEAQREFNTYIRLRDRLAGHGCICCGEPLNWNSGKPGGDVDAGHFVSRGSAIELAFDERNVNAQRKSCNRPGGTTRAKFTAGMTQRYGAAVVAELEGPHELPRLKHDDLRAIRAKYRAMARALEKQLLARADAIA